VCERPECGPKHSEETQTKLHAIHEPDIENRLWPQAICPKEIDKVRWREVQIYVLQTKKGSKNQSAQ